MLAPLQIFPRIVSIRVSRTTSVLRNDIQDSHIRPFVALYIEYMRFDKADGQRNENNLRYPAADFNVTRHPKRGREKFQVPLPKACMHPEYRRIFPRCLSERS